VFAVTASGIRAASGIGVGEAAAVAHQASLLLRMDEVAPE
jgi:hypothetical protein